MGSASDAVATQPDLIASASHTIASLPPTARRHYLEHANTQGILASGKYDVSRTLSEVKGSGSLIGAEPSLQVPTPLLESAA